MHCMNHQLAILNLFRSANIQVKKTKCNEGKVFLGELLPKTPQFYAQTPYLCPETLVMNHMKYVL